MVNHHEKTSFWENMFGTLSKHPTSKSMSNMCHTYSLSLSLKQESKIFLQPFIFRGDLLALGNISASFANENPMEISVRFIYSGVCDDFLFSKLVASFLVTSILNGSGKMMPLFRINRVLVWSCPYIQRISCITTVIHGERKKTTFFGGKPGTLRLPAISCNWDIEDPYKVGPYQL